jgi:SET domain-containing protein
MLRVKVKPHQSALQGTGLFADEFIPKGTVTWQYDPEFDLSYDQAYLDALTEDARTDLMRYLYYDYNLKKYVLCSDDQKYINHSNTPNIQSEPDKDVASRDIAEGEELVCNYEDYEVGWFLRRGVNPEDFK